MSAEQLNLDNIEQGASWSQQITLDPVVDLTGFTGSCKIRQYTSRNYPVLAVPTVTLDTPAAGVFTLSLTADRTSDIPCTGIAFTDKLDLVYDVTFTDGTDVIRVLQGSVSVIPGVTL
jgi:hypothetical protein